MKIPFTSTTATDLAVRRFMTRVLLAQSKCVSVGPLPSRYPAGNIHGTVNGLILEEYFCNAPANASYSYSSNKYINNQRIIDVFVA